MLQPHTHALHNSLIPPKRKQPPDAGNASSERKRRRSTRLRFQPPAPASCLKTAPGIALRRPTPPPLPLTKENGQAVHFMQCIKKAFLDPIPGDGSMELLIGTRKMLRNILDYSMGERLASIKSVMVGLRDKLEVAQAARASTKASSKSLSRRLSTRLPSGKKAQPEAPQPTAPHKASSTNLRRKSQPGALSSPSRSTGLQHNGQPEARRRSARISSSTTASRPDELSRTRRGDEGFSSN